MKPTTAITPPGATGRLASASSPYSASSGLALREQLVLAAVAIAPVLLFSAWLELSPQTLGPLSVEDGAIETTSAALYLVSALGLLLASRRSRYLEAAGSPWAYLMIWGWAALAFVMFGEEISWGQRIFGFDAPEAVKTANSQDEFNVHNLYAFAVYGGTYRYLSIFALLTGLVFPVMALTDWGRRLFQRFYFPVAPLALLPAFVGAYLFGKYYIDIAPSALLQPKNAVNEVRELLIGYGMALYGLIAARKPDLPFRVTAPEARRQ